MADGSTGNQIKATTVSPAMVAHLENQIQEMWRMAWETLVGRLCLGIGLSGLERCATATSSEASPSRSRGP